MKVYRGETYTFKEWIEQNGVTEVARLLGVNPMAVFYWKHGKHYPRVEVMRKIRKLTSGVIGYDEILDGGHK